MFRVFAALVVLLLAPAPAFAQTDASGSRRCLDDNGADRCAEDAQAEVRALLGVAAIEDEAASGAVVYRAFFVDGYGRDMPAVAFERRPGQSPEVVIYGRDGRTLRGPVSGETWDRVAREARFADRALEPLPQPAHTGPGYPPPPPVCLHAWVQTIEMANVPRERFGNDPVRRRTENGCDDGPTSTYAFFLAETAVDSLPACARLDGDRHRNSITRLVTCMTLSGDQIAAADLYNGRLGVWRAHGSDVRAWRGRFGINSEPVLTWGDQVLRSTRNPRSDAVAEFLAARVEDHPGLTFWPGPVEGLDARRVAVTGRAEYAIDETRMTAAYRQTWQWDTSALEWMLADWTVEPFEAVPQS